MNEYKDRHSWMVDLIGVILTSAAISFLGYLGMSDSETGEIEDVKALAYSIVLHSGSYFLSYLLLLNRDRYFNIPRWILVAIIGSILCSITFRIPVNHVYLEGIFVGIWLFGAIALAIMGSVRLIYWVINRNKWA
jgi:hypothetical protein